MAITADIIYSLLREKFPHADLHVDDYVGDGNHFEIKVMDDVFIGCSMIQQHRMVHEALRAKLDSNELHAVKIVTGPKK